MATALSPARWKGGPPICPAANLPAFPDEKAAAKFREANCPSCKVRTREVPTGERDPSGKAVVRTESRQWLCPDCGHWHYDGIAPDPAGASSGNGRGDSGAPIGFVPFRRRVSLTSSKSSAEPQLKKQEDPHAGWKGPFCAKCDSPVKGGKCVNKSCVVHGEKREPKPAEKPLNLPKAPPKADPNQRSFF